MEFLSTSTWVLIILGIVLFGGIFIFGRKKVKIESSGNSEVVVPLKVQAFERLVLYLERIRFSVLVKRVFMPGMSRSDLQFALIQNVQDELEHNLAQRLYVDEKTWFVVVLAKDEVLEGIKTAFDNNQDADAAMMAQILASQPNSMIDRAIITIKNEFNSL